MMYSQPLVSVVIPCYNHEQFVQDSIQSVIDQTYENIELIIIDDGSKDSSVVKIQEMLDSCKKRFVRFEFRYQANVGLNATLNEALEWCKGEYFSPIASDDIALPHKIRFLIDKIHDSKYAVVFGDIRQIGNTVAVEEKPEQIEHTFEALFMQETLPAAPAALMRTHEIRDIGGYSENIKIEDWYMWLKLTSSSKKIISFKEVVCLYRRHDNNTINDIDYMHVSREEIIKIYSKNIMYDEAMRRNTFIKAKQVASESIIDPILLLLEVKYFNKQGALVLLKALTPRILIKAKRKMHKKYNIILNR